MYPLFFYLCVGLYHRGINHSSFSRSSSRAHLIIHFNIVWRYIYSIRLFLIEAKHRYNGKNMLFLYLPKPKDPKQSYFLL